MRNDQVQTGRIYEVRVSGRLVPLQILSIWQTTRGVFKTAGGYSTQRVTSWLAVNLRTGKKITLRAQRLRRELSLEQALELDAVPGYLASNSNFDVTPAVRS
jgi:hypothetical protein